VFEVNPKILLAPAVVPTAKKLDDPELLITAVSLVAPLVISIGTVSEDDGVERNGALSLNVLMLGKAGIVGAPANRGGGRVLSS
jgi:hypothetical protein